MHRKATLGCAERSSEGGQALSEYVIVLAVIVLTSLLTVQLLGESVLDFVSRVINLLASLGG